MDENQVRMSYQGTETGIRHMVPPINAVRVVIDPTLFPESKEFEVIVERMD